MQMDMLIFSILEPLTSVSLLMSIRIYSAPSAQSCFKVRPSVPIGFHSFHYLFATYSTGIAYDIRTIQELLGHSDVKTTMGYTHVLNCDGRGVQSPIDRMGFFVMYSLDSSEDFL